MREWWWRFVCGLRKHRTTSMVFETSDAHVVVTGCACGKVSKVSSHVGQHPRRKA